jgi:hypothetical protein
MSMFRTTMRAAAIALLLGSLTGRAWADEALESTSYYDENNGVESSLTSEATGNTAAKSGGSCCSSGCKDFCGDCCCDDDCCPCWTVRAGVVVLTRGRPHNSVLVENTISGATVINASDFNFNWNVGADISARKRLASGRELEVRYFGVDGNTATLTGNTPALWDFPTTPPLIGIGAVPFESVYLSKLFSTEINLRQCSERIDGLTWLVGFRWLQVSDQFNTDFNTGSINANFSTLNNLYGAQIGADMLLWSGGGPFRVDGVVKVGAYGNSAHNGMNVTQTAGPTFNSFDNENQFSFVGEIGITAAYQVSDHVAVRGGYQLLWLEGVATSGDQIQAINVTNGDGINTGGEIFYHGAMASLDFTW